LLLFEIDQGDRPNTTTIYHPRVKKRGQDSPNRNEKRKGKEKRKEKKRKEKKKNQKQKKEKRKDSPNLW